MKKFFLVLFAVVTMATAESYPYTHDGFFMNIALGLGGQGFDLKGSGMVKGYKMNVKGDADGGSFEIDWKFGGRILPFTILHATFLEVGGLGDLRLKAEYRGQSATIKNGEVMCLYGVGATYYIYPYNFFVSGSLGSVKFGFSDEDDGVVKSASEFGFGFQLAAGKEWWISENWGLGASVAITYGSVDEDDEDLEMSALAISFMISATFN